jgi:hypothetical protein
MAAFFVFSWCEDGLHSECPKEKGTRPNFYGGEVCTCPCHIVCVRSKEEVRVASGGIVKKETVAKIVEDIELGY